MEADGPQGMIHRRDAEVAEEIIASILCVLCASAVIPRGTRDLVSAALMLYRLPKVMTDSPNRATAGLPSHPIGVTLLFGLNFWQRPQAKSYANFKAHYHGSAIRGFPV